jgi:hypothetical protein
MNKIKIKKKKKKKKEEEDNTLKGNTEFHNYVLNKTDLARRWWLMPVILATQEAKIKRMVDRSQTPQIGSRPYFKKPHHKNRVGVVAHTV